MALKKYSFNNNNNKYNTETNPSLGLFTVHHSLQITLRETGVYRPTSTWPHLNSDVGLDEGEY